MATQPNIRPVVRFTPMKRNQCSEAERNGTASWILFVVKKSIEDGGMRVSEAMCELKQLGYSHKEAARMVLEALGFKVQK